MEKTFYKLPLDIGRFFTEGSGGELERCTEIESVDQFLGILFTSFPGEHVYDNEFGCRIWDMDFENIESRTKWEERFTDYVRQAVVKNEKRLRDVEVKINVRDVVREELYAERVTIRKMVEIFTSGVLKSTNGGCTFRHEIFMGPLSNQ